jgi:hypothetical protein
VDDLLECQPDPGSVRAARLFVVDKLQEWHADDLVDSAALLTSELATNAVLHTRRPFTVGVRRSGTGVRVEVIDGSEDRPHVPSHLRPDPNTAEAGDVLATSPDEVDRLFSGLGMVDAVANDWGTQPIPGKGKVVWFELRSDGRNQASGLSALRHDDADEEDLTASLPPLTPQGLDGGPVVTLGRVVLVLVFLAILAAVVYAGLWAGGVLGTVWYGH